MNDFLKRSITGIAYVSTLIFAIMANVTAFKLLFLLLSVFCFIEFFKIINIPYYSFALHLLLFYFVGKDTENYLSLLLLFLSIATNIFLMIWLFSKEKNELTHREKLFISPFYLTAGLVFIPLIYKFELEKLNLHSENLWEINQAKLTILFVLCTIWASDSFAYLIGKQFGKHKLFPLVSPKKTIEGLIGGFAGGVFTAIVFANWSYKSVTELITLAIVLVGFGAIGDLIESKFKRVKGIKDSGNFLPGHGGFLDRLDSLIYAAPFAYLILLLFNKIG